MKILCCLIITTVYYEVGSAAVFKRAAPEPQPEREFPDWDKVGKDALMKALQWRPQWNNAKNVVFFLGDGLGIPTQTAARFFKSQYIDQKHITSTSFSWEDFRATGLIKTYSMDLQATDSSSAATAFLCGQKALTGAICVNQKVSRGDCAQSKGNELKSLLHYAIEADKWTGLVSTALITDATPATAFAHSPDRKWYTPGRIPEEQRDAGCMDIASQLVDKDINKNIKVVLGGGRRDFLPTNVSDPEYPDKMGERDDGRSIPEDWKEQKKNMGIDSSKYHYVEKKSDFDAIDPESEEYLFGLFEYGDMQYEADRRIDTDDWQEPSLAEMVEKSIKMLKRSNKGFFLFVEAARIDHAHHDNNAYRSLMDVIALDDAVKKTLEMVDLEDTLIVVSADHSLPMMQVEAELENDIMGLSHLLPGQGGGLHLGTDGKPFTVLSYGNGPGYMYHQTNDRNISDEIPRKDLTGVDTTGIDFVQDSLAPRSSSTHSGEDVAIFAAGPMSHLFNGLYEQSNIAHYIKYIGCLGEDKSLCETPPDPPKPTGGATTMIVSMSVMLVSCICHMI